MPRNETAVDELRDRLMESYCTQSDRFYIMTILCRIALAAKAWDEESESQDGYQEIMDELVDALADAKKKGVL